MSLQPPGILGKLPPLLQAASSTSCGAGLPSVFQYSLEIVTLSWQQVTSWTNWKTNSSSWILQGVEVPGEDAASQIRETWWADTQNHSLLEEKPMSRNPCGNQCQDRKPKLGLRVAGGSEYTSSYLKLWGVRRGWVGWTWWGWGGAYFCEFHLPERYHPHTEHLRKIP